MKKVAVMVCNFASITESIIDQYGITAIVSNLQWPEMDSLVGDNVFQKMRDALSKGINSVPKTSQPSMGVFKKYFEEALRENDEIICITISSKISGTYNSALQTKKLFSEEMQKKIHIIDSNNIDVAESLLAIKAVEISKTLDDIGKIIEAVKSYIPRVYFYGMTENPDQMEAGGRINHVLAVILSQMQKLGMRPILSMDDGVVKPANLKMNAKDTAEALFRQFEDVNKKGLTSGSRYRVAISHADNIIEAEKLKKIFEEKYPSQVKIDFISMTGIFIGAHVGPGTLMCSTLEEIND
ncbi:MAG: DegV family protein [Candidatus Paceibacterota bacterium]|jgi:DegV family protein with EDD domain|nr:DegV family protein [bacterium]